jgi:maltooligosyltrehalose trehalohydrolase
VLVPLGDDERAPNEIRRHPESRRKGWYRSCQTGDAMTRGAGCGGGGIAFPSWRRYPVGVEVAPGGGGHVRVWAPDRTRVELVVESDVAGAAPRVHTLVNEGNGYFSAEVADVGPGARYRYRLDDEGPFPDPVSRFQPEGPHGPSMVIDPSMFDWGDGDWPGVSIVGQVMYELHIGTFTSPGTFRAAIERLPDLADVGASLLEIMPVGDFSGRFGWGYDGVNLFAPSRLYGSPDDFRAFVDAAHQLGIGVILDVVYNHVGPDGNYLKRFASGYFSAARTEWGESINFDGEGSQAVREYVLTNAAYWVEEFHLDGLRLDATQQIFDGSMPNIVTEIAERVRRAARGHATVVIAENEPQRTTLVRPVEGGGSALDALWNDDFHHAAHVALTGQNEAYLWGFRGTPQEFISAAKYGFLYQGQWFRWQHHRRGTPALDLPPHVFVNYLQNHDQVANGIGGRRVHLRASPGRMRAMTALLLLMPQTPLLFQGQEFGASSPFQYFADQVPELARSVFAGRMRFLSQFPSMATPEVVAAIEDPGDPATFIRSKLDWRERDAHASVVELHRTLARLRRNDGVVGAQRPRGVDGAVLSDHCFVLRYFGGELGDRLLAVNLGMRLHADPTAEPLLAPPIGARWETVFSSEDPRFGGSGTPQPETVDDGWWLPAESAVLFSPTTDAPATPR